MTGRASLIVVATVTVGLAVPVLAQTLPAAAGARPASNCSAGARTLSPPGARLYPDTGNGGYVSLHTTVHLVYDASTNRFLPGNRVTLADRATQCLSSFSLDFERRSSNTSAGPDLTVKSVAVNGQPASF
ncbi:MAG TPA: hypothetical protein VN695_05815, partial [Streptosporangiaceae bacterium]|nr:hypothetical protein [Streptosporangiaceae bacterium]